MNSLLKVTKKIILSFILFLVTTQILFSQDENNNNFYQPRLLSDSTKNAQKKVCTNTDFSYLNEVKEKRAELIQNISNIQKRRKETEDLLTKPEGEERDLKKSLKNLNSDLKHAESELERINSKLENILKNVEYYYFDLDKGGVRFIGDAVIEPNDKINSNVSLINGSMIVKGKISGDLVVINGIASIESGGAIEGKVILVNSEFYADSLNKNHQNLVCGDIKRSEDFSGNFDLPFNFYTPRFRIPPSDFIDDGVFKYNRVEGLYFGLKSNKKYYWNGRKNYSFYSSVGYGFSNHRWTGNFGFDRWIGNSDRTEFGVEAHSIVDSKDNWLIDPIENSVAAFFIHEDFKDYFLREGWEVHASQYINKFTSLRVDYIEDKYRSLIRNTDWSLFGGSKTFRDNPQIDDGSLKSFIFSVNHNTVDQKMYNPSGWAIYSNYEIATGSYSFKRLFVDFKRYQPIESNHGINARLVIGSSEDYLPLQRSFDLGGLGTIPSLRFKEYFGGNRMALFNVEFVTGLNTFFDILFNNEIDSRDNSHLILSYDAGWIGFVPDNYSLFEGFEFKKDIKQNVGIALGLDRDLIRVGFAFRVDKPQPATFFFRISRPF